MSFTRKRKSKRNSVCSRLSKNQCRFPCKKVFSDSEFIKCRSIFSKKKKYLDDETKQVVYDGIKLGRKSEKKAHRYRTKASESRKLEEKAKKQAVNLEGLAETQDKKTTGFLESVSIGLFGKKEPETGVLELEPAKQDSAKVPEEAEPIAEELQDIDEVADVEKVAEAEVEKVDEAEVEKEKELSKDKDM